MPRELAAYVADDLFTLGAAFVPQFSQVQRRSSWLRALDWRGNTAQRRGLAARTEARARYQYRGRDLTADLELRLGEWRGDYRVERLELRFAAGEPLAIELWGHQPPCGLPMESDRCQYDMALKELLPSGQRGWDVPAGRPFAPVGRGPAAVALRLTFALEHRDWRDRAGEFCGGFDLAAQVQAVAEFRGAGEVTTVGWDAILASVAGENLQERRVQVRAQRPLCRTGGE